MEKIVGTPFWFSRPKRAKMRPPDRDDTAARERTTAAYASFAEPRWRKLPALQARAGAGLGLGGGICARFAAPPQPAAPSASKRVKVVKVR